MAKTLLAIGAHYDDCVFGIPGILLRAVRKNYRVVVLTVIGDYDNWKPTRGRGKELVEGTTALGKEYGVEHRFLKYASMNYDVNQETKKAVAEEVAKIGPDIGFMLWSNDTHADHEVASQLSKVAFRHGDRMLNAVKPFKSPSRIYLYDNGPRHTIGFEPNTFVDISDDWNKAIEWIGRLSSLVSRRRYDPSTLDGSQRAKEAIARYRGFACGAKYAEALQSFNSYPQEIL